MRVLPMRLWLRAVRLTMERSGLIDPLLTAHSIRKHIQVTADALDIVVREAGDLAVGRDAEFGELALNDRADA